MSLLFNTLFAWKASGTHHKLAMDALLRVQRHDAEEWRDLFLAEVDQYLKGSKTPDDVFKDFKNHVLHVGDHYWGGAVQAAEEWYEKTVQALSKREWPEAVFNAGVCSHYFTDPIQPFHTGQSERETIIHRAAEWSITKSYDELKQLLLTELGGYPTVKCPTGSKWLQQLIYQGAEQGHVHYDFLIDHYNFEIGVKKPELGMDRESKVIIARLIGFAAEAFARVLEKAIEDAGVLVPSVHVSLPALLATAAIPMKFITKKMGDAKERAQVEAMFTEYKQTGKVLQTMPEDDRLVRRLYCEEVLKIPLAELDKQPAGPIGTKYVSATPATRRAEPKKKAAEPVAAEKTAPATKPLAAVTKAAVETSPPPVAPPTPTITPRPQLKATAKLDDLQVPAKPEAKAPVARASEASPADSLRPEKVRLTLESPIVDAPSIGNKTADRFAAIGIRTVGDFLDAEATFMANRLRASHLNAEVLHDWQDQSRLILQVPSLKGHDAQLLVGVDIRTAEELANANARDLHEIMEEFCGTNEGKRILRESSPPDLAEVGQWIVAAKRGQANKAA
jgi:hypothetical protein